MCVDISIDWVAEDKEKENTIFAIKKWSMGINALWGKRLLQKYEDLSPYHQNSHHAGCGHIHL